MILDITILSALIVGLTEVIKKAIGLEPRFIPIIAILLAVILGLIGTFTSLSYMNVFEWLIAGLLSVGLYSTTKNTIGK